jgi:hypothetical protein
MEKPNKRPAPAYQEFASDMLAKREYRLMEFSEKGLLFHMRLECWVNKCLPSQKSELAQMFNLAELEIETMLTQNVLSFFTEKNGSLFCTELDAYRENLEATKAALSEGGRKGGQATQKISRQAKATLEAEVKPLRRDDVSRDEGIREELTNKGVIDVHKDWLNGYGDGKPVVGRSYLEQSRGI